MTYTEELVELVKAAGQEIIDRAEDLVGKGDLMKDFHIHIEFPQENGSNPEITVSRTYFSHNVLDRYSD